MQTLVLTPANIRNNYLRIQQFNGLIPQEAKTATPEIFLELEGIGHVRTTIDQKKGILSERHAIREFFHKHRLNSGDEIGIRLTGNATYEITSNKNIEDIKKVQLTEIKKQSQTKHLTVDKVGQKKLSVGFVRTCNCPPNHLNCMTAKEWIKSQIGVWQFYYEGRDIRKKDLHPAVFPIALAKKIVELFTHKGELVVDPFVGSGTTLVAARDTNRNAVGFDLQEKYIELCKDRLSQQSVFSDARQIPICDDARNVSNYLEPNTVKLFITSPPYANLLNRKRKNKSRRGDSRKNGQFDKIEQYSQDSRDLGLLELGVYSDEISHIYEKILPLMCANGHCIINVADMWWENQRIPIHISIVQAMERVGYKLRNTIIWDRTNIVNKIGIFGWPSNYITMGTTFEYILHFIRA